MAIKDEHKAFIRSQVLKNCSARPIKKELDRSFPNEATPSHSTVERWASFLKLPLLAMR